MFRKIFKIFKKQEQNFVFEEQIYQYQGYSVEPEPEIEVSDVPLVRLTKNNAVIYWCFGCNEYHGCDTTQVNKDGGQWEWNNSLYCPTLKPSVHLWPKCHHNVVDGYIYYGHDCTHEFRGQKIRMQPVNEKFQIKNPNS